MKTKRIISSIFTYAIYVIVGLITLIPILYVVLSSFKTNAEIFSHPENLWPQNFTVENYVKAFQSEVFDVGRMLVNSLYYTGTVVISTLLTTSLAAYAFSRGQFPLKKTIWGMFSALLFIHLGGVSTYATFQTLSLFGLTGSLHSLLIVKIFAINVTGLYLIRSYIDSLPKELDEAARIDGCGKFETFFKVILPLLKPILATVAILTFQASWNDYLMPTIYTQSYPEQRTLIVGIVALKNSGEGAAAMNLMLAGTTIALVPVIAVYIMCNKFFVSGLTAGAVKG